METLIVNIPFPFLGTKLFWLNPWGEVQKINNASPEDGVVQISSGWACAHCGRGQEQAP